MGRHVIVGTLIGGARLDLSQAELAAPEVTLTKVSLVGGVSVRVPSKIRVEASGLSILGGTRVEGAPDPGPGAPTIHIRAFSIIGGIRIRRDGPGRRSAAQRLDRGTDWRADRRADRLERLAERRSRRDRFGGI
jgi:hypothetical protein